MLKNTISAYGNISKFLHWLIAVCIIALLMVGVGMQYVPSGAFQSFLYTLHKSVGLLVLILGIFWIIWTIIGVKPIYADSMPTWQRLAARCVHGLLYLCIIVMPLIGWMMSTAYGAPPRFFWLYTLPQFIPVNQSLAATLAQWHEIIGWIILGLLIIHSAAALKHHLIDKDNILKRILFTKNKF